MRVPCRLLALPLAANFDLVGAGAMVVLVMLLNEVDTKARRVTAAKLTSAAIEMEMERNAAKAAEGQRGARGGAAGGLPGVRATGRGTVVSVVRRR